MLKVASVITDPVTTTDELILLEETSSYRSNPEKLASFTLSRKDPNYVPIAGTVRTLAQTWQQNIDQGQKPEGDPINLPSEILAEFTAVLAAVSQITTPPSPSADWILSDPLLPCLCFNKIKLTSNATTLSCEKTAANTLRFWP